MATRTYTMRARAEQAEQTRLRILDSVVALAAERPLAACTLPAIAERAGVAVQTVLRAFGSRDGVFAAAIERTGDDVIAERLADPDDIPASLRALVEHYDHRGDLMLLLLGQERWEPVAATAVARGKKAHRDWVSAVFARALAPLDSGAAEHATDLLVAATDVFTWKLWRRDLGRSHDETLDRMRELVASLIDRIEQKSPPTPRA
ncbi:TetR/AcrR family transcriptional regulator [Agromyces sp. H66]|uniref:TetR/AcrR family transcriptional regulator n=1 Tax=Agromyces sp. H66 TaxID=2529859 RepID=UPI00145BB50C|nr:TetR/AcrR family transcriptional regulator [Agromyces sp. H66]